MLDKEVAIFSIVVLFIMIGVYLFFFQIPSETSVLKPVVCTSDFSQSEIILPKPLVGSISVEQAIKQQNQDIDFQQATVSLPELSSVLWAAAGIIDQETGQRSAPSPSMMHPMQIYVVPNRVDGASCGIYRFDPEGNKLVLVKEGRFTMDLVKATFGFEHSEDASVAIIIATLSKPIEAKFGMDGAYRLVSIEAGHMSQNMILESWALGLGAAPVGIFSSEYIENMVGIDGQNERAIYMTLVGKPMD